MSHPIICQSKSTLAVTIMHLSSPFAMILKPPSHSTMTAMQMRGSCVTDGGFCSRFPFWLLRGPC